MTDNTPWPPERVEELQRLWAAGSTAATIALKLRVTKNAVVGKAKRIGLPSREHPSRRRGFVLPKQGSRATPNWRLSAAKHAASRPPSEIPARPPPVIAPYDRTCQWPIGEPDGEDFRLCGTEAPAGAPYCTEHHAIAYGRNE